MKSQVYFEKSLMQILPSDMIGVKAYEKYLTYSMKFYMIGRLIETYGKRALIGNSPLMTLVSS